MWVNVYLVMDRRGTSVDTYMVHPTQEDALAYYRKVTGRPGRIDQRVDSDGHETIYVDMESYNRQAVIIQHKLDVSEFIDSPL